MLSVREALASKPFCFVVGDEEKVYYVHKKILSRLSSVFDRLMNGPMVEAKEDLARLEDIEPDTFERFLEFAYTKDYEVCEPLMDLFRPPGSTEVDVDACTTPPTGPGAEAEFKPTWHNRSSPQDASSQQSPAGSAVVTGSLGALANAPGGTRATIIDVVAPEPHYSPSHYSDDSEWDSDASVENLRRRKKATRDRRRLELEHSRDSSESLEESMWDVFKQTAINTAPTAWRPRPNELPEEDFSPIFLCHAKLYVFADRYQVRTLQTETLRRMHCTLAKYYLYWRRTTDVVKLIEYVYENTPSLPENMDPMRNLIIRYAACHVELLIKCQAFQAMISNDGQIGVDLMKKTVARVV